MLTGTFMQVFVVIGGATKALDHDGNLVAPGGFQFPTLADAMTALNTAIANNTAVTTKIIIQQTPA